jgi:hypothetical protein
VLDAPIENEATKNQQLAFDGGRTSEAKKTN